MVHSKETRESQKEFWDECVQEILFAFLGACALKLESMSND